MGGMGGNPPATPSVMLPSLDAAPSTPAHAQLPSISQQPQHAPQTPSADLIEPRQQFRQQVEDANEEPQSEKALEPNQKSGGWFRNLTSSIKSTFTDPKAMKLPDGSAFEWDNDLKAHVPTDPKERMVWLAERDKLAAPPPAPASNPATPGGPTALGPQTPRVSLTNPLDTLDVGTQPRTARGRRKPRAYANGQGFSPAQRTSSQLAPNAEPLPPSQ